MEGRHNRLQKWAADRTWEKVFTALLARADAEGDLDTTKASDAPEKVAADVDFPEPCDLPSKAGVRDFNLQLPGTDSNYNTSRHQECIWNGAGVDLFGIGHTTNSYKKGQIATVVPGTSTSSATINDAGICVVSWPAYYGSAFAYADVDPSEEEDPCDAGQAWASSMYFSMPS
ncbi:hypothetical protein [Streptomyces sp. NPDC050392]|uniref:hypothetical protein n=1 Tax=Streptomyces sp. NPDC050392 TaxID=3155782 RepID=UPI0034195D0B